MESTLRKQNWGWEYVSKNGKKYVVGEIAMEFNVIVDEFEDINELFDYDALIHSHLVDYVYGDLETDTEDIKEWLDERIERYENHERTVRFYTNLISRDDCNVLYECYVGSKEQLTTKAKRSDVDTMMRLAEEVKGVNRMEIRFYSECYNRTLVISFPNGYEYLKDEIETCLDQYYDEWVNFKGPYETEDIEDMCLEDYMMERLSEIYNMWTEWTVEEDTL